MISSYKMLHCRNHKVISLQLIKINGKTMLHCRNQHKIEYLGLFLGGF